MHTDSGPYLVAFNGTNSGAISSANGNHHADQVIMNCLIQNGGIPGGDGPITIKIRGRDICPYCADAFKGLAPELAAKTGRNVKVEEESTGKTTTYHPDGTRC